MTPVQWASGQDESVEVNQRALIDKVLARYSGEFTVFRELLQNSDDAQATAVEIHFNTQTSMGSVGGSSNNGSSKALPDLKTALVRSPHDLKCNLIRLACRCMNGLLRTTESLFARTIGLG